MTASNALRESLNIIAEVGCFAKIISRAAFKAVSSAVAFTTLTLFFFHHFFHDNLSTY